MKQILLIWVLVSSFSIHAKVLTHPHTVIKSYWPQTNVIADSSLMLLPHQVEAIYKKHGLKLTEVLYKKYIAKNKLGKKIGVGLIISDKVRTKSMTLLLLIDNDSVLKAVEVISFFEPMEYKPAKSWFKDKYENVKLEEFVNNRQTANISGATLSAHSVLKVAKTIAIIWKEINN